MGRQDMPKDVQMEITGPDGRSVAFTGGDLERAAAGFLDALTVSAARHVVETGKASVTGLQRQFGIGYARASALMEALEAEGVVTAANHVGKREVAVDELPGAFRVAEGIGAMVGAAASNGRAPMKETAEDAEVREGVYRVAADELRSFCERFERLEAEKKDIADQMKEVMAEAKARGYDTKVLRKVIALRKRDRDDIAEEEAVLQLYREALGV
ncbi:Uncharacterized conserved protein, UPF0335 family [Rhodovulum sp. ES.010]|nr:Uncharacterized conserved protein, UPF0335 family [Rhodovulum sp. ES.010]